MPYSEGDSDNIPTPAGMMMHRLRRWRSLEGTLRYAAQIEQFLRKCDGLKPGDKHPLPPLGPDGVREPYDKIYSELSRLAKEIVEAKLRGHSDDEEKKRYYRISDIKGRLSFDSRKMVKAIIDAGYSSTAQSVYSGEHGDEFGDPQILEGKLAVYREAFGIAEKHIRNISVTGSALPMAPAKRSRAESGGETPKTPVLFLSRSSRILKTRNQEKKLGPETCKTLELLSRATGKGRFLKAGKFVRKNGRQLAVRISRLKRNLPSGTIIGSENTGWKLTTNVEIQP